jgi:hypothetical protein
MAVRPDSRCVVDIEQLRAAELDEQADGQTHQRRQDHSVDDPTGHFGA